MVGSLHQLIELSAITKTDKSKVIPFPATKYVKTIHKLDILYALHLMKELVS